MCFQQQPRRLAAAEQIELCSPLPPPSMGHGSLPAPPQPAPCPACPPPPPRLRLRLRPLHPPRAPSLRLIPPSSSAAAVFSPLSTPEERADYQAAADFGEEDGAVVDETTETEEQRGGEYVSSVGAGAGLPAFLRAGRAGPGGDPVFFLLTAVAITTSVAFSSMVAVAIPTMLAMRRAANSFTMLADAALDELPSTMAAVRLSGMEISDLTCELSDLSHEISDGVNKSAKVAQAVEASIGQMRDIARQQAISMAKERANLQTIPTAGAGPDNKSRKSSSKQL